MTEMFGVGEACCTIRPPSRSRGVLLNDRYPAGLLPESDCLDHHHSLRTPERQLIFQVATAYFRCIRFSVTMCPSNRCTIRWLYSASAGECVTMTMVVPASLSCVR